MKLVEFRCKNCNSLINVEEGAQEVTCQYCLSTFKIDDEVKHIKYDNMEQSGYEFEKGRIRAQMENKPNVNINIDNYRKEFDENPTVNFVITLCFGMFGVHKFMKNQIGMGILYLFTGGIFGIGYIIDVIKSLINLGKK